jgi:hypothetical protein
MGPDDEQSAASHNVAPVSKIEHREMAFQMPNLPAYDRNDPSEWILDVQMAFAAFHITEDIQKCHLTMMALPATLRKEIRHLPESNATESFEALKQTIKQKTAVPVQKRIREMLRGKSMGDMRPSQILQYIRQEVGSEESRDSAIIRTIFLEKVPVEILRVIAPDDSETADEIAKQADKIHRFNENFNTSSSRLNSINTQPINYAATSVPKTLVEEISDKNLKIILNAVGTIRQPVDATISSIAPAPQTDLQQIASRLTLMEAAIATLQQQSIRIHQDIDRNYASQRQSRSRYKELQGQSTTSAEKAICYYHRRFGDNATCCTTACSIGLKKKTVQEAKQGNE